MPALRACLQHISTLSPVRRAFSAGTRHCFPAAKKGTEKAIHQADGPLAERLKETGVWGRKQVASKTGQDGRSAKRDQQLTKKVKGDRSRVNIVSEKLCNDIISYIGRSLDRHKGCDILDIYPGAGLWSRTLNDALQPRSHLLLEPDTELYEPFLEPLLARPGTKLIPKSGIVWRELNSILTEEYLPRQKIPPPNELERRNDTLLVTASLAFHPRKRFSVFDSVATLLIYQFINAIRHSTLFQKYGQVRMLLWTTESDKRGLLPRCLQRHYRTGTDGELYCETIQEICSGSETESQHYARDSAIDRASALVTLKRMQEAGLEMPRGRCSTSYKKAKADLTRGAVIVPGTKPADIPRQYKSDLASLQDQALDSDAESASEALKRSQLRWRKTADDKRYKQLLAWQKQLDLITSLRNTNAKTLPEIRAMENELDDTIAHAPTNRSVDFAIIKDNLHLWRQTPPLMHWDRRKLEPMTVKPEDFFPNVKLSLLDIQPKPAHPLLRQVGPKSNRAGDIFELISRSLMVMPTQPLPKALDAVWPGAAEYVLPRAESLYDTEHGGVNSEAKVATLTPRMLNARQWEELLEKWMDWPFRPDFFELISRSQDAMEDDDGDGDGRGAVGLDF